MRLKLRERAYISESGLSESIEDFQIELEIVDVEEIFKKLSIITTGEVEAMFALSLVLNSATVVLQQEP